LSSWAIILKFVGATEKFAKHFSAILNLSFGHEGSAKVGCSLGDPCIFASFRKLKGAYEFLKHCLTASFSLYADISLPNDCLNK
jgi:hypothetical protein